MFFILSLINIPFYWAFNNSTKNNNLASVDQLWKYFTIGNIGNTDNTCNWSSIDLETFDNEI